MNLPGEAGQIGRLQVTLELNGAPCGLGTDSKPTHVRNPFTSTASFSPQELSLMSPSRRPSRTQLAHRPARVVRCSLNQSSKPLQSSTNVCDLFPVSGRRRATCCLQDQHRGGCNTSCGSEPTGSELTGSELTCACAQQGELCSQHQLRAHVIDADLQRAQTAPLEGSYQALSPRDPRGHLKLLQVMHHFDFAESYVCSAAIHSKHA